MTVSRILRRSWTCDAIDSARYRNGVIDCLLYVFLSRQVLGQEAWRAAPAKGSEGRARLPQAVLVLSFAESSGNPENQVAT